VAIVTKRLNDIIDKVVKFCAITADIDLYDYQTKLIRRVIQALLLDEGEELTVLMSRQSGKSEAIASLLAGISIILPLLAEQGIKEAEDFRKGIMIGIFAPSLDQVATTYHRALDMLKATRGKEILNDPEINEKLVRKSELRLLNGSFVKGQSGAKQSQIESKSYHLIIVEEAQDMDTVKVRKSIHPMLAAYNGTVVKVGTANKKKSDFYETIVRNRARSVATGNQTHFQFDYKEVIKDKIKAHKLSKLSFHLKYAKFIKSEIRRIGIESEEFRMSYGVEFMLDRGMFMTESLFDSVTDKKLKTYTKDTKSYVSIGIDIGKSHATTVITAVKVDLDNPDDFGNCNKSILNWYELKGNYEEQFWRLEEIFGRFNVVKVTMDSTGVGDSFTDRVKANFTDLLVEGFKFSLKSKSDLYKHLDNEIKVGRLKFPGEKQSISTEKYKRFKVQMLGLEKDWKGAFLSVHKAEGRYTRDDYGDSLALAVWGAKDNITFEIEEDRGLIHHKKKRPAAYW